jgi:hypothetical protein
MADEEKPMDEHEDDDKTVPMKRDSKKPGTGQHDGSVGGSGGVSGGMSSLTANGNERVPPRRK